MAKHFYAIDYANKAQPPSAFTSKKARDNFVENGNRRFAWTRVEADMVCQAKFECNAGEAVARGYI
tara:strand:+ start:486 stop:683 length:198 start_codon:yes stop_codon:yes gene_type:complete